MQPCVLRINQVVMRKVYSFWTSLWNALVWISYNLIYPLSFLCTFSLISIVANYSSTAIGILVHISKSLQSKYLHMDFSGHITCPYLYLLDSIKEIALQNYTSFPSLQHFMENGEFPFPYTLPVIDIVRYLTIWWVWQRVSFSKFAFVGENNFSHLLITF